MIGTVELAISSLELAGVAATDVTLLCDTVFAEEIPVLSEVAA